MKRKSVRIILMALILISIYAIPANAQPNGKGAVDATANKESILLPPWEQTARDIKNNYLRGTVISTGITEIGNPGGGDIEIALTTLAHKDCDEIRHKAYLDRWDEATESWYTVDSYNFLETKEEHPDEPFSALLTTFVVYNQPTNHYYRVRTVHMATYGARMEVLSSQTDGILITKD